MIFARATASPADCNTTRSSRGWCGPSGFNEGYFEIETPNRNTVFGITACAVPLKLAAPGDAAAIRSNFTYRKNEIVNLAAGTLASAPPFR
jgi:hypothetical protein